MIKRVFQPPKNWADFENLCCDLWRVEWACSSMQSNGRNGQKQQGVDCYGKQKFSKGWTGIQCKRKETYPESILTYGQILKEVEEAKAFKPALEHLIIATTYRRCSALQEKVRELSDDLTSKGYFSVVVSFWDDIEGLLNKNTVVAKEYYKDYYSELSEEERKLFLIKNPTKINLTNVKLKKWLGVPDEFLTFNLTNVGEMPALSCSLRIFKSNEHDIDFKKHSTNSHCFIDNLKIDKDSDVDYPLILMSELIEQLRDDLTNYEVVGVGLSSNIPEAITEEAMQKSFNEVKHLESYHINHSWRTFPLFVKYKYSSPFGSVTEVVTGVYIYLKSL
ncbi:hypothetical protein [Aliivibrio fischeri]|nr:hypothetical protein [Aliivibrio fischeri]